MVARVAGVFDETLTEAIANSKILVVGAGGIGCEILKNLVLTEFPCIEVIDLDTIDVSNLNRQFLFRKEHVGKSKAEVAKESALSFNPNVNIVAHHDSIISNDYDLKYFKKFNIVMNALDNRVARNHVNRMCLAADVPLIETGTAGYSGQVELIKKGVTQCYECQPKAPQKTFPGCTIRNTPSEPIHCVVWAKHLFNQLFGEEDPDQDVSPDTEDPEAAGEADAAGNVQRTSTRAWAAQTKYDPEQLFGKLFGDDVRYLLSMHNLWRTRRPPAPLQLAALPGRDLPPPPAARRDQAVWTPHYAAEVWASSVRALVERVKAGGEEGGALVWDKDARADMDFVAAAANLRAHCFNIPLNSRFTIKSMAGNIIPAIATTNAMVAGAAVLRALQVLRGELPTAVYVRHKHNHRGHLLVPDRALQPPAPACYVCSAKCEATLQCDVDTLTLAALRAALIAQAGVREPDVTVEGRGVVVLSSEPGETSDAALSSALSALGLRDGTALLVDDFLQQYELRVTLQHAPAADCTLHTHGAPPAPAPAPAPADTPGPPPATPATAGPSRRRLADEPDSDLELVEDEDEPAPTKRRRTIEPVVDLD